jgi:putative Mg2+ transporter-C (MgtC) family protein
MPPFDTHAFLATCRSEGDDQVALAATLIPTTAEADELDAVCDALEARPEVIDATWSVSTTL